MERNWGFMKKILALGVAAMFFGLVSMSNARADVIAIALDKITNYSFASPPGGLTVLESPNITFSSDSASFNGVGPPSPPAICPIPPGSGPCNPGGLSANAVQATAGPGPFPGQDDYTKPPAGGFVGSRGDANVTSVSFGVPPTGAGAANAAESRLNTPSTGSATGSNTIVTNLTIQGSPGQSTSLNFSFVADPYLQVAVSQAGDIATAVLGVSITLIPAGGGTSFLWTPGLSSGEINVASETDPFSLNQTLTSSTPAQNQIFNPASGTFSATSGTLSPGTYTLTLQMNETVRTSQISAAVPEPSTLLLFSFGLLGLGGMTWRRAGRLSSLGWGVSRKGVIECAVARKNRNQM